MIFRVQVAVVLASSKVFTPEMLSEMGFDEIVSYWFGINARDVSEASSIAVRAAESAVDTRGEFIGGIVMEVHAKCVGEEEFRGYDEFLIQPMNQAGIFYVTGVERSTCGSGMIIGAEKELNLLKQRMISEGVPPVAFVHPKLPDSDPPSRTRLYCPVCEHWIEMDGSALLYSFFDGFDPAFPEYEQVAESRLDVSDFIDRHSECLKQRSEPGALVFLNDEDENYNSLDESKRE